jgi:hypothetical protein
MSDLFGGVVVTARTERIGREQLAPDDHLGRLPAQLPVVIVAVSAELAHAAPSLDGEAAK